MSENKNFIIRRYNGIDYDTLYPETTKEQINNLYSFIPAGVDYLTTAPEADNSDGLKFVILSELPETKYNGYLYIITEA